MDRRLARDNPLWLEKWRESLTIHCTIEGFHSQKSIMSKATSPTEPATDDRDVRNLIDVNEWWKLIQDEGFEEKIVTTKEGLTKKVRPKCAFKAPDGRYYALLSTFYIDSV